jgi:hypothetical protein
MSDGYAPVGPRIPLWQAGGEASAGNSGTALGFAGGFALTLAPPYPSIEDELSKDVAILKRSLEIRDEYIDTLRAKRRSLIEKLDGKDRDIEWLERRLDSQKKDLGRAKEELAKLKRGSHKSD